MSNDAVAEKPKHHRVVSISINAEKQIREEFEEMKRRQEILNKETDRKIKHLIRNYEQLQAAVEELDRAVKERHDDCERPSGLDVDASDLGHSRFPPFGSGGRPN